VKKPGIGFACGDRVIYSEIFGKFRQGSKVQVEELIRDNALLEELQTARRERKPWLGKGAVANIASYFTVEEFEALVNQAGIWSPDRLQVFLDHEPVPPGGLFHTLQSPKSQKHELNPAGLQQTLAHGSSVVLNDICGLSAGVMEIRETLADWTGGKLDCNLYFSQKDHQAFPVHYDVHDVLAFQVEGKKHWQVFEQAIEYPINHPAFKNRKQMNPEGSRNAPLLDFEFEPGDLVYIPSGYFHHATCRDGMSIHLAFGLVEMIGMDVISLAFEMAMREEFFRAPVNAVLREKDPVDFYLRKWAKQIKDLSGDPEFKRQLEANLKGFRYGAGRFSLNPAKEP